MSDKQPCMVFINPPYDRIAPGYEFVRHITNQSPSLGLLHLAAQVRENGYRPVIIESDVQGYSVDQVVKKALAENPDYVGITLFTVGVWGAAQIARKLKEARPDLTIIVGGPHISSMGKETLERFPEFDYAVDGEGELVLESLLKELQAGNSGRKVNGVLHRVGDMVFANPKNPIEKDLDSLPFPAWDLLPGFPQAYKPAIYDYPKGPAATIAASRGCPFHCKFCDTSTFGARVRTYSPEKIFEMVQLLHDQWGVRHIAFVDDLFLASRVRVSRFCELLIDSGIKISWSCTARVDTVKPDVLELMKRAGCWEISFGLETGSNWLLQQMDKVAEVEQSEQAVTWTAEAGIRTKGLFMLGYPGETEETIAQTRDFVRRIPMQVMNLTKFTPYPGSPIYRDLYGTNIRADHWEKMNGMNFVWAPDSIDVKSLDRHYQQLLTSFYRRPKIGNHYIAMTLRYPNHFWRLLRFGAGFVRAKVASLLRGDGGLLVRRQEVEL